jgi:diguanylate cyclase
MDMKHFSASAISFRDVDLSHRGHKRQTGLADLVRVRVRQARTVLAQFSGRITGHREASQDARQHIQMLARSNARLKRRVVRLRQEVARVRHLAYHDELTGLPNRSLLMDRLTQAMTQAARQHKQVGLLLLDLDRFKSINDRHGHAAGDKLLQCVAERLSACTRSCDTVCRYGGDEFVIMLPEIDGWESADVVARKIHTRLCAPFVFDDRAIVLTASIGIALYRTDGRNGSELIREADNAMYLAKANGGSPTRSHWPASHDHP